MQLTLSMEDLEEDCNCGYDWNARERNSPDWGHPLKDCLRCRGTGTQPTETGQVILDFVRKYGELT